MEENETQNQTYNRHSSKARPDGHARKTAKKPPKKITETYLQNAGLHYLQRYSASTGQFRAVMLRKIDRSCRAHADQDRAACARMLEDLIGRYIGAGLLNDADYARGMVSSLRRRGLSARAIQARLQEKHIDPGQIADGLRHYDDESGTDARTAERQAALKLAQRKKIGPFAPGANGDSQKALATLARAGFSFDVCREILGAVLPDGGEP